jgi:hypothetical protein
MSLGEDRVRVKFNPSATDLVDAIKQKSAQLIDMMGAIPVPTENGAETDRLISLARTAYEEAAMWAVKAATTGK